VSEKDLREMFQPSKDSRDIQEYPDPKVIERRASPGKRKQAKELKEFPNGVDVLPPSNVLFGDLEADQVKRLRAMLINFLKEKDGSMLAGTVTFW